MQPVLPAPFRADHASLRRALAPSSANCCCARCRCRSRFECQDFGGSHRFSRHRASSSKEGPLTSPRTIMLELKRSHRRILRTISIGFPSCTKAGAGCAGFGHGRCRRSIILNRSTGHRLGLSAPSAPLMYYSIQNCMPHLLWMLTPCEPNGVGLESPGRRSSSQAGRATCTFAERDHTGTGKRTGKTKTVKPHTHARARGRRKR